MDFLREWLERIRSDLKKYLPPVLIAILGVAYLLGVLATGIDRTVKGVNFNPFVAIPTLLSASGRALMVLLVLVPLFIWTMIWLRNLKYAGMEKDDDRNFWFSDKGTYGTAESMNTTRMKKYFHTVPENRCHEAEGDILGIKNGLVLSRPEDSFLNKHVAVVGASGSMKSRAICRNKIIGCKRRGESMILTDPKGELFRDTAVWLRKAGYTVRVLNLVSLSKSNGWNFMEDALGDCLGDGDELEVVEQMAYVIIQNTGGTAAGHEKDDFWDKGERGLLKALLLYQYYTSKKGMNPLAFSYAYKFLLENDVDKMKAAFNTLNMSMPMNAATSHFNIFLQAGERVCPNIHFGLLSRLSIFNNQRIQDITGRNEMNLELPAREKCAYFVITPDQHSTYDFLTCLFFTLFFIRVIKYADTKTTTGRCDIPVNLLLDEFPNIGEIPDFSKKLATVRSRDVSITILFQSIPDLMERYPSPSHYRILNNCDYLVFLGGGDPFTAEYFSERSGEATILVETEMENHNKFNPTHFTAEQRESAGSGQRMVKTLNEIQTMAKDDPFAELIVMRDQPILECQKFDYTRDPASKEWELFSMDSYDPSDPFWFDTSEENQPTRVGIILKSTPAPSAPAPLNTTPNLDIDPEQTPFTGISIPDQTDGDPSTATPDYRQEMADSEKRSFDFLKQQAKRNKEDRLSSERIEADTEVVSSPPSQYQKGGMPSHYPVAGGGNIPKPQKPKAPDPVPEQTAQYVAPNAAPIQIPKGKKSVSL